jgi:NitT/TauT family transport system ATP-binding protein
VLDVAGIRKGYDGRLGERVLALNDVTLTVGEGEFVSLVGPSGCGKSTLLGICAGLVAADEGRVTLRERPVHAPQDDVGIMFQDPVLLPWKTATQNVLLPRLVRRRRNRYDDREAAAQAAQALEMVGLEEFASSYPWELSGGMQRRVSLARIVFQDPAVLLMDEPFAALDEFTRLSLNVLFRAVLRERGKTVVLVTHSVEEAVLMGHRVGVMTPRPGELRTVVDVELPEHRDDDLIASDAFARQVVAVRQEMAACR